MVTLSLTKCMQVVAEAKDEKTAAPVEVEPEPGFVTPKEETTSLLAYCDLDSEGNYKCRLCQTGVMDMLYFQAHLMTEAHQRKLKWFLLEKKKEAAATAQATSSAAPAEGAASKSKSAPKKRDQDDLAVKDEEQQLKTAKMEVEPKVEGGTGAAAATAGGRTEQATATAVEEAGEVQAEPKMEGGAHCLLRDPERP